MRNVIVTGGSRGLGFGIAQTLVVAGYRVIAVARKETSRLTAAIEQANHDNPGSFQDVEVHTPGQHARGGKFSVLALLPPDDARRNRLLLKLGHVLSAIGEPATEMLGQASEGMQAAVTVEGCSRQPMTACCRGG